MTGRFSGQFSVKSREDLIKRYEQAELKDCRINAYPEAIEKDGFLVQPPNFVFIDLDLANFNDDRKKLDKLKNRTLRKMEQLNGSYPTVSWTGNDYHLYLPIDVLVLDNEYIFQKINFLTSFRLKVNIFIIMFLKFSCSLQKIILQVGGRTQIIDQSTKHV